MNKKFQIKFFGIVQGVGFRPFIYRVAKKLNLKGFVKNRSDCVLVEIETTQSRLNDFIEEVKKNSPPASKITKIEIKKIKASRKFSDFRIIHSEKLNEKSIFIPPDIATCEDCLKELFNPKDRRYLYPFINCTNCGPRLTIIKDIPYDRVNTSMSKFKICETCKKEYENPLDRRFHAEPIACPECGPHLSIFPEIQDGLSDFEIIKKCAQILKNGEIVAIKGLGGFHLAVDATNFFAVEKLRKRKLREEKPFAIMVKDINSVKKIAHVSEIEEKILTSSISPIVLLKKKKNSIIAENVSPNLSTYGIMLPYTPLHHLLLNEIDYLVMTSANKTDEPICIDNQEAKERLKEIADYYILHNREIVVRCDDSIVSVFNSKPVTLRHSRGFSPAPLILSKKLKKVMALGGNLKNSIAIIKDNFLFLSPHVGDLENPLARDFFIETEKLMKRITSVDPEIIAVDLHPDYFSTNYALKKYKDRKIIKIQHHHAHITSCMAENGLTGDVIGISCDGTGFGIDGKIWGGEILIANEKNFKRIGHIEYFGLIGGEKAIKEIWRLGLYFLFKLGINNEIIEIDDKKREFIKKMIEKNLNIVECSSLGRLFDAVSSIIGLRHYSNYEGQPAMELEAISLNYKGKPEIFKDIVKGFNLEPYILISHIIDMKKRGYSIEKIAMSFHFSIIYGFIEICKRVKEEFNLNRVVLSGGCFQNKILTENLIMGLKKENFNVYFHSKIPPNDGGISAGQAYIAGS